MIEDIYEMKNVYTICLRASNGEFFRIRRKIYKDKAEALEVVRKMNERTHCDSYRVMESAYWKELEEEPTC